MLNYDNILAILSRIAESTEIDADSVKEFQRLVWIAQVPVAEQGDAWGILSELAYDLDFWEPDSKLREEDPSYYGDERAREEIRLAIRKLRGSGVRI